MQDPAILEKLKKLLRVSDDNGHTEAEMSQALAHAQRLALKHGIDLDEVDATEEVGDAEPITDEIFTPERAGGGECAAKLPTSTKFVVSILQEFFRVEVVYITKYAQYTDKGQEKRGHVRKLQIFGKKTNVMIATHVFNFLCREFGELWRTYKRKVNAPMASRQSYYNGLYVGLYERLRQEKGEVEREVRKQLEVKGTSLALVLVNEGAKIKAKVNETHPRMRILKDRDPDYFDADAMHHGKLKGKEINIRPTLGE